MTDPAKLEQISAQISALLGDYIHELNPELIATEWVCVVGSVEMAWTDGRQSILTIHPDVPYSARLGLLTSAQFDHMHGATYTDDDD